MIKDGKMEGRYSLRVFDCRFAYDTVSGECCGVGLLYRQKGCLQGIFTKSSFTEGAGFYADFYLDELVTFFWIGLVCLYIFYC